MPILTGLRLYAAIGMAALFAVLLVALLATRGRLSDVKHERDEYALKLSVSNASIGTLEGAVARMAADQKALANDDANRVNATRQKLEYIEAVADIRQAAIDRLEASAQALRPVDATGQCSASDALKGDWQ